MATILYHAVHPTPQTLAQIATEFTGVAGEWSTARTPRGKPYFPQYPHLHFSISHSGGVWLCAMSDAPVGLDVQSHERAKRRTDIAKRFFHPQEQAFLQRYPEAFFTVWAAKESYVKYWGNGIDASFSAFSVSTETALLSQVNGLFLQHLSAPDGFSLCLCSTLPTAPLLRELELDEPPFFVL